MPVLQRAARNDIAMISGALVILLAGLVMFGWAFGIPAMTQFNPDWNPMVPGTALCFMLSGLSLLQYRRFSGRMISSAQRIMVWLILLLAGARVFELVSGRVLGFEHLAMEGLAGVEAVGHMSPLTVVGFLAFGIGMLVNQRDRSRKTGLLTRTLAGVLLALGLFVTLGYWLRLQYFFEPVYLWTGLIWMSLPTAIGMTLLGVGLWSRSSRAERDVAVVATELNATRINRATLIVVAATSIITAVAGLQFLDETVIEQASSNMTQLLNASRESIAGDLESRTQYALLASLEPEFRAAATALLRNADNKPAVAHANRLAEPLLDHGFSGIGLEGGGGRLTMAGRLLPSTATFVRLNGDDNISLAWDNGYTLRVRVPLDRESDATPAGFLVFEQALPHLNRMIEEGNRWGDTGSMPMCARLDRERLLCFPQREQGGMYVVPDTINGHPLPMTYALAGQSGIKSLVDYRGHYVLSAYGPLGNTSLGLVLRMDLAELYAPAKKELLVSIPLIALLVLAGLWTIRSLVNPLVRDLADAYSSEKAARARFDAAMQSSPDGFVIYESIRDQAGDIVDFRCAYLNHHAEKMVGLACPGGVSGNLVGSTFLQAFPERTADFIQYRLVVQTRKLRIDELSLTDDDGATLWFMRQAVPMSEGLAITYREVTQERRLVQQLEYSNRLRSAIMESAAYSIISTDVNGIILTFNQAAERMLWYRADEMVGKATPELIHDAEEIRMRAEELSHELGHAVAPGFEVIVVKAKVNLVEEHEWTYVRKDGSRFPVLLSVTALRDEYQNINGYLGIAYDISERKRNEEYIRHIALHDVLTGLPNRALLDDRVMVAIEQQHRHSATFALAMMDIDHFKHINDSMGHHMGDMLLKEFVECVKSCLRPVDTLARMGGDEFVLLLPDSDQAGAETVVERILHKLVPPVNVGIQEVHVTASIGISICPRDGQNLNELLRCADVAMYWVKEHGRNGYKVFSPEMDGSGAERLGLERDLHLALEHGGFSLLYQPKVDLKTNIITGVEALLRLRRADGQYVSPADFIPLAEETGLIVPIGQWVLETACRDVVRMQNLLGAPLGIAVNISPRQFMNSGLVGTVEDVLGRTSLDAAQLELEITESVLMDDRSSVAATLSALHALGVRIAIDDFGTGYSSLSYLKRYPISRLKIDQSFVRDVTTDSGDAALIAAIIAMGRSLNISVIAEGIETDEQLAFLVASGCDQGQGFHIGHPMAFDALLHWLADDSRWQLDKAPR
ncbi:cyclic di-GMP phosphodiesterase Gmr [mine drainage metagenome]|uniref:Cyclic di-GMP phosphodiesterase Gmr n=1 Tax=mine drainage metagenome TaxID=410659 RepID=A0A1J5RKJ2_9ZZZZ